MFFSLQELLGRVDQCAKDVDNVVQRLTNLQSSGFLTENMPRVIQTGHKAMEGAENLKAELEEKKKGIEKVLEISVGFEKDAAELQEWLSTQTQGLGQLVDDIGDDQKTLEYQHGKLQVCVCVFVCAFVSYLISF